MDKEIITNTISTPKLNLSLSKEEIKRLSDFFAVLIEVDQRQRKEVIKNGKNTKNNI